MKAFLMFPDRDFEAPERVARQQRELAQDLALDTLLAAMAGDDPFLLDIGQKALGMRLGNDVATILYRQENLADCLENAALVRELYHLAEETMEIRRKGAFFGLNSRHPRGLLSGSIELLEMFLGMLRRLRALVDLPVGQFRSRGFTALFAMLRRELGDEYLADVQDHLARLRFRKGVLLSAELGGHNEGVNYVLRQVRTDGQNWLQRMLSQRDPAHTIYIHERDEAGARALSELEDRGITRVATAASQATQHVLSFFEMLRTELAFYVGGLNLHERLAAMGAPISWPRPAMPGTRVLQFRELYDVCLALTLGRPIVGNTLDANGKQAVIVTGANQGGKSTFLRSVGLAQVMMQCGLFVGAESFRGDLSDGLFTHYTREEDATMKQGKLDEELGRMSDIVDAIGPCSTILFNESFAATNEREGSEIATQVVSALLEKGVRIFFVTHLYQFAHGLFGQQRSDVLFLRAERQLGGARTFRVVPGEPLETSYGKDLYAEIFSVT